MSKIDDAMLEEDPLYFARDFQVTKKGDGILIHCNAIKGEEWHHVRVYIPLGFTKEPETARLRPVAKILKDYQGKKFAWVRVPEYKKPLPL